MATATSRENEIEATDAKTATPTENKDTKDDGTSAKVNNTNDKP